MDILLPDNWLRVYLKTAASPKKITEALSLCGPSVDWAKETKFGTVYAIEVTTNRVDSVGVYGIAREASAILPRFGIKASLIPLSDTKISFSKKVNYLDVQVDFNLCQRFAAVLVRNVQMADSPEWMRQRLEAVGLRPINNIVDISNYIMHEIGQPVHTFDYDKIMGAKMILRASREGERVTTLDEKTYSLPGDDIIIEDGSGRIIDLAGIMGGLNSAVDKNTKNVLLFVQTYNPINIRKTSMRLAHKTEASILFEKALDPELVTDGIKRGINLFEKITKGKAEKLVLDLYPNPYKNKQVNLGLDFIQKRLGVVITYKQIVEFLKPLGFGISRNKNTLNVSIPSWRNKDVSIPEDILEEIARIYGYHKIPSKLMGGTLPEKLPNSPFEFENKVKLTLKNMGAIEAYTNSLVSKEKTTEGSLRLKNPLGKDGEYLRNTLRPSLIEVANLNNYEKGPFHIFEMANVYLPKRGELPEERMTLAGIFVNCDFRIAKGTIEALLENLNVNYTLKARDSNFFTPSHRLEIIADKNSIGVFGQIEGTDLLYYEFDIENLSSVSKNVGTFKPISRFPPQIEDVTLTFPEKTVIGSIIEQIEEQKLISKVELKDTYNDSFTFRIWYQHPTKTLTNIEVAKARSSFLKNVKNKFGATEK